MKHLIIILIFIFLFKSKVISTKDNVIKKLKIGFMGSGDQPYGPEWRFWNTGPAFFIALEKIKASKEILANVTIEDMIIDTQCNKKKIINDIINTVQKDGVDAYIGPPCSSEAISGCLLTSYWNIPNIAYAGVSSTLSDKRVDDTYSRTVSTYSAFVEVINGIVSYMGWQRICTVAPVPLLLPWVYIATGIDNYVKTNNITVIDTFKWQFLGREFYGTYTIEKDVLKSIKGQCRGMMIHLPCLYWYSWG